MLNGSYVLLKVKVFIMSFFSLVYVDMGNVATDTTTLAFTFTGTSTTRIWEIKVSQLTCSNANRFLL